MKKLMTLGAAAGIMLAAVMGASPAWAAGLVECVEDSAVCLYDDATIGDQEGVANALDGNAKVAVVPQSEVEFVSANQLAAQLAEQTNTDELILVVDMATDRFGVYSKSGVGDEVLAALNGAGVSDGGEAIISSNVASVFEASPASSSEDGPIGGFPSVLLLFAVSAACGLFLGRKIVKGRRKNREEKSDFNFEAKTMNVSEDLRKELTEFQKLSKVYARSNGDRRLQTASAGMETLLKNMSELFNRLNRKGKATTQSQRLAEQSYLITTRKLNEALGEEYFGDIVAHPNLWEDSEKKAERVLEALSSVNRQVIDNIRQVNASKELEFRIALDTILMNDVPAPKNSSEY